jgi:hypothetical protein
MLLEVDLSMNHLGKITPTMDAVYLLPLDKLPTHRL